MTQSQDKQDQKNIILKVLSIIIRKMSRAQSRNNLPITTPLMKVNELINSIYAVNSTELIDQLHTCSKIVSQLLHNQLIDHINSIGAAKLLCYELVLLIAEENAVQARPRISFLENAFGNNKKIKFTASMRNTLSAISELLDSMMWKNVPKKRGGTQKVISENSPLYEGYVEFKQLLNDFDKHFDEDNEQILNEVTERTDRKKSSPPDSGQDENEALIEQLQQIVAKKQRRIKQLNEQLEENILQQRAQQDLIGQLQCRNIDLKQQLELLNKKLSQKDSNQLYLHQKIQMLKAQALTAQKQLNSKKHVAKTQKTIKTKFTIDDEQEPSTVKKQYRDFFDQRHQCMDCQAKKDITMEDVNCMRRMLLTQAISIQALI